MFLGLLGSLINTFKSRMRFLSPVYFFSNLYRSLVICVFSASIWAVVIPAHTNGYNICMYTHVKSKSIANERKIYFTFDERYFSV